MNAYYLEVFIAVAAIAIVSLLVHEGVHVYLCWQSGLMNGTSIGVGWAPAGTTIFANISMPVSMPGVFTLCTFGVDATLEEREKWNADVARENWAYAAQFVFVGAALVAADRLLRRKR